jgi:hypothetical protein
MLAWVRVNGSGFRCVGLGPGPGMWIRIHVEKRSPKILNELASCVRLTQKVAYTCLTPCCHVSDHLAATLLPDTLLTSCCHVCPRQLEGRLIFVREDREDRDLVRAPHNPHTIPTQSPPFSNCFTRRKQMSSLYAACRHGISHAFLQTSASVPTR